MRNLLWGVAALLALTAPAAAQATSPGGPEPMVCAYNATLPTLAAGGTGLVQCDAQGRIIISNPGGAQTTGATPASTGLSVSTTVTQIAAAATGYVTRIYQNNGTAPVCLGGSGVTYVYPSCLAIQPGQTYDLSRLSGALYGIAGSAAQAGALIQY